jgi:hypothetical protein
VRHLLEVSEVATLIRRGEVLLLAGDETALRQLPTGRWIAGTIPYFMADGGGVCDRSRIFVEHPGDRLEVVGVRRYPEPAIARVYLDLPPASVGLMIVPWMSRVHLSFALNAPAYERFAGAPLFGWVSGVHLDEIGRRRPLVFDGTTGEALDDHAVVLQAALRPRSVAELGIINIFEPGDGPVVTFPETSFTVTTAQVDGRAVNLAEHVLRTRLDTRLPLVADYCGARVNVSFESVDPVNREVRFFAPVFADVPYRHARRIGDYVRAFASALPQDLGRSIAHSCNCVLNYRYSSLEGRSTGGIVGPITFGEIAYQLLNQTMVYLTVGAAR